MNVRKSSEAPSDALDELALDAADVGVIVLRRGTEIPQLRGPVAAHLGLDSAGERRLQDILDRLSDGDRAQLSAQIAAWTKGELTAADATVQVASDTGREPHRLRLRVIDRGGVLLLVTTRQLDAHGNLMRAASHALRSPLNALLGWVHVLALKRPDDEEVAGISARLARASRALLRTVNDLQDLDHLKRGRFRLEKRPFQLIDAIEGAVQAQDESAQQRNIDLVAEITGCDTSVEGDPNRLRQLFEHLLRNAIHHSEPASRVEIACERRNGTLQVTIRDYGSGLTQQEVEALFHGKPDEIPFNSSGLGAGLPLAREIVARHRGTLAAESHGVGKGVTVTVTLPARVRDAQKKAG